MTLTDVSGITLGDIPGNYVHGYVGTNGRSGMVIDSQSPTSVTGYSECYIGDGRYLHMVRGVITAVAVRTTTTLIEPRDTGEIFPSTVILPEPLAAD